MRNSFVIVLVVVVAPREYRKFEDEDDEEDEISTEFKHTHQFQLPDWFEAPGVEFCNW